MNKNYISVPASQDEDINQDATTWRNGKYISIDEGTHVTVYIDHQTDEEGNVTAFPIRVEKPATRASLINGAEQSAYNLITAMDVASFNASLARKAREGETNYEVQEHDDFIQWVKDELTKIGI